MTFALSAVEKTGSQLEQLDSKREKVEVPQGALGDLLLRGHTALTYLAPTARGELRHVWEGLVSAVRLAENNKALHLEAFAEAERRVVALELKAEEAKLTEARKEELASLDGSDAMLEQARLEVLQEEEL